jgi:hypothetical protein
MSHAVGRRAEQHVAHEVPAVADDDHVMPVGGGVMRDHLGGVTRHQLGAQLHAAPPRRGFGVREHARQELVPLALDLVDLAERCGVARQLTALAGTRAWWPNRAARMPRIVPAEELEPEKRVLQLV